MISLRAGSSHSLCLKIMNVLIYALLTNLRARSEDLHLAMNASHSIDSGGPISPSFSSKHLYNEEDHSPPINS